MTGVDDPRFRMHPWSLAFADVDAERAWWADFASENLRYVQAGVALLAAVYAMFAIVDEVVFPNHLDLLHIIRFGVVVPVLLLGLVVACTDPGQRFLSRWIQEYLLLLGSVAGGGLVAVQWLVHDDVDSVTTHIGIVGYMMTLTILYGFSRLRFAYAVPAGFAMTTMGLLLMPLHHASTLLLITVGVFVVIMNGMGAWITHTMELLGRREFARRQLIHEARVRSESLLRNALPEEVAARLKDGRPDRRAGIGKRHDAVTVVLADLVDFTPLCERLPAYAVADLLDRLFSCFDALCAKHGVEKIKTLGDAWLAAAGVPSARADHVVAAARLALDMRDAMSELQGAMNRPLSLRIGIHSGPAVSGVIGRTRYAYDLWSDAVEGATAMERGSAPGRIRVSPETAALLGAAFEIRRETDDDGRESWWLERAHPPQ